MAIVHEICHVWIRSYKTCIITSVREFHNHDLCEFLIQNRRWIGSSWAHVLCEILRKTQCLFIDGCSCVLSYAALQNLLSNRWKRAARSRKCRIATSRQEERRVGWKINETILISYPSLDNLQKIRSIPVSHNSRSVSLRSLLQWVLFLPIMLMLRICQQDYVLRPPSAQNEMEKVHR